MSKRFKVLSMFLTFLMVIGTLAGCSPQNAEPAQVEQPEQPVVEIPTEVMVYQGLGKTVNFRVGPGKDSKDVQVYSFNYVTADATFDKDGKIINVYVDGLEVSTPNYDGESMPHFSGWPGTEGYNVTDHSSLEVSGVSDNTEENIAAEVNGWQTKRERGDTYGMNYDNDWYKQMDHFQEFFKGKTIAEIEAWFDKYCSDVNGRPLKDSSTKEEDIAKYAKLTDAEKAELADVVSGATFSLNDAHGNIIGAIKDAYENRVEVIIPMSGVAEVPEKAAEEEVAAGAPSGVGELVDGTYKVEFDSFDSHGYKPQLELVVSGSKVTAVSYDEVKEDGSLKSKDEAYKSNMEGHSGTYPEKAFKELAEKAVSSQTSTVDTVSGATASTKSFNALLKHATEEMASKGETSSAKIPALK